MSQNERTATLREVICIAQTDKAIKVRDIDDPFDTGFWVPQSVVHDDSEVYRLEDEGTLVVLRWWAVENGWDL